MSTVQVQMARLAQRLDPKTDAGVDITAANVGSVDGARFSKSRLLDVYNEARLVLSNVIMKMDQYTKREAIGNNILTVTNLAFASGAATKPTGYVSAILLTDVSGNVISVLPQSLAYATKHLDSLSNRLVYERSTTLASENGNTYIPDAATYVLRYFGIAYFTLADVTGGAVAETFNPIWESVLLELAAAISLEQGLTQVNALASSLAGGVRRQ